MNPLLVMQPFSILLVAAGGAMGCVLRFMAINQITRLHAGPYPLGTLAVNIIGSLLIGVVLGKWGTEHSVRAFVVTGMLGGFTTFSAFSWDMLQLLQRGQYTGAVLYVGCSVILSLGAVALGFTMVR